MFCGQNLVFLDECPMWPRRRVCILWLLHEIAYRRQLCSVDWWRCFVQLRLYWFSACWISPFPIEGCWSLQGITTDLYISPCSSISFCFIYFDTLLLDAYTLRFVFLESWPLYYYIMLYCVIIPGNFPCFEVYSVWI